MNEIQETIEDAKRMMRILEENGITRVQFATALPFLVAAEFGKDENEERYLAFLDAVEELMHILKVRA